MSTKDATEYHLSRWNTYHDTVKTYNQELSIRFGTIFTIITSAWVLGSPIETGAEKGVEEVVKAAEQATEGATSSGGTLLIIGMTLAPVLLTLLLLHEMRIFIQYQQDNYFMIYHAYNLCKEDHLSEFEHILNVTQGSGTPVATFLFMFLSNAIVLAVPIINLVVVPSSGLKNSLIVFARFINIGCLCAYIAGAVGSIVQYFILCRQIDSKVWIFAVENNIKLTGAKVMRSSILSAKETLRYLLAHTRMGLKGKGNAAKSAHGLNDSFTLKNLSKALWRLNRGQRKALFACIYDSWYRTKEKPDHILPYTAFIDVTAQCNLSCAGCFANDLEKGKDIDFGQLEKIIAVLKAGGVKALVLTGGEPTLWEHLYDVIVNHRDILFLVFTNGQKKLFEQGDLIKKLGNLIFIFSIDGDKEKHEARRGQKTYQPIIDNMNYFKRKKIGFATSTTVSLSNFDNVQDILAGLETYKPAVKFLFRFNSNDTKLELDSGKYGSVTDKISKSSGLVVNLPHDEARSECKGCVAGKYIFHIRQDLMLGKCPFMRRLSLGSIENLSAQEIAALLEKPMGTCKYPPEQSC